jgi:hypothetical protein
MNVECLNPHPELSPFLLAIILCVIIITILIPLIGFEGGEEK